MVNPIDTTALRSEKKKRPFTVVNIAEYKISLFHRQRTVSNIELISGEVNENTWFHSKCLSFLILDSFIQDNRIIKYQ